MTTIISNYRHALRRAVLSIMLLSAAATAGAYTVEWAIPPSYARHALKRTYRHGLYQQEVSVNNISYTLLVDTIGRELYRGPAGWSLVPFGENGLDAICYKDSLRGKVFLGLFFEKERRVVHFPPDVNMLGTYVTDGCIRVQNPYKGVGYIGLDGNFLPNLKCQFKSGEPFHEGFALVEDKDGELMYIDKTGKPLKTNVGHIERATSFRDGRACVKTKKGWTQIDREGKDLKYPTPQTQLYLENAIRPYMIEKYVNETQDTTRYPFKADPFDNGIINRVATEDSELGYNYGEKTFVPIQFLNQDVEDFDGDYCVVMMMYDDVLPNDSATTIHSRCQGLLRKLDGDYVAGKTDERITMKRDGTLSMFHGSFSYPTTYSDESKLHVRISIEGLEDPVMADKWEFHEGKATFEWDPNELKDIIEAHGEITYQVYGDYNLLLWEQEVAVVITPEEKPKISKFRQKPTTPDGKQTIEVQVSNPWQNKELTATFTITQSGVSTPVTATIPPRQTQTLAQRVDSSTEHMVTATVELTGGQSQTTQLIVKPYVKREASIAPKRKTPHAKHKKTVKKEDETPRIKIPYGEKKT